MSSGQKKSQNLDNFFKECPLRSLEIAFGEQKLGKTLILEQNEAKWVKNV